MIYKFSFGGGSTYIGKYSKENSTACILYHLKNAENSLNRIYGNFFMPINNKEAKDAPEDEDFKLTPLRCWEYQFWAPQIIKKGFKKVNLNFAWNKGNEAKQKIEKIYNTLIKDEKDPKNQLSFQKFLQWFQNKWYVNSSNNDNNIIEALLISSGFYNGKRMRNLKVDFFGKEIINTLKQHQQNEDVWIEELKRKYASILDSGGIFFSYNEKTYNLKSLKEGNKALKMPVSEEVWEKNINKLLSYFGIEKNGKEDKKIKQKVLDPKKMLWDRRYDVEYLAKEIRNTIEKNTNEIAEGIVSKGRKRSIIKAKDGDIFELVVSITTKNGWKYEKIKTIDSSFFTYEDFKKYQNEILSLGAEKNFRFDKNGIDGKFLKLLQQLISKNLIDEVFKGCQLESVSSNNSVVENYQRYFTDSVLNFLERIKSNYTPDEYLIGIPKNKEEEEDFWPWYGRFFNYKKEKEEENEKKYWIFFTPKENTLRHRFLRYINKIPLKNKERLFDEAMTIFMNKTDNRKITWKYMGYSRISKLQSEDALLKNF